MAAMESAYGEGLQEVGKKRDEPVVVTRSKRRKSVWVPGE
jgi:hypothetical protein